MTTANYLQQINTIESYLFSRLPKFKGKSFFLLCRHLKQSKAITEQIYDDLMLLWQTRNYLVSKSFRKLEYAGELEKKIIFIKKSLNINNHVK